MEISESSLSFLFQNMHVLKFDDSRFYRKRFNSFELSKGVDIIGSEKRYALLMEVKNFSGHEVENR